MKCWIYPLEGFWKHLQSHVCIFMLQVDSILTFFATYRFDC